MIHKSGRCNSYLGSVDNTEFGRVEIKTIQKEAKIFNAEQRLLKMKNPEYVPMIRRVALYGRLGKNNPKAGRYKTRHGYGNPYARIRLEDAATVDIYQTLSVKVVSPAGYSWYKTI